MKILNEGECKGAVGYQLFNMRVIVKLFCEFMLAVCLLLPATGYAEAKQDYQDYEEAYQLYVAAGACLAAYSDRMGKLAYEYLEQEGWQIESYTESSRKADARFLFAKKNQATSGQPTYLLAIVGTETMKDIKTDLRVDQVYFAGSTLEEFEANAGRTNMPDTVPKVHRGFHQFVQAALTAKKRDDVGAAERSLADLLLADSEKKVYLVGHSLGGAAATIGGARLLSMGVQPGQIKVITFGAPAVGNAAFSRQYEPVLDLTRVVIAGDPVSQVMQKLVGGYEQFGRQVRWEAPETSEKTSHQMVQYLDLAIKSYYQKRSQAMQSGEMPELSVPKTAVKDGKAKVYIAPVQNDLPERLRESEFWYMEQALQDEYRRTFAECVLTANAVPDGNWQEKAVQAGCQWLIVPEVSGYRSRDRQNGYYITLRQTVYDTATGDVISLVSFSTSTDNLTPLEALIHDARNMAANSQRCVIEGMVK